MILKVELIKEPIGWRFIDKISNLESRGYMTKDPDGGDYWERVLLIFRDDTLKSEGVCHEKLIVSGKQQVYLCNDEGKTIEKIN